MENEELVTEETLPSEETPVVEDEGGEAADPVTPEAMSLRNLLKKEIGKDFESDEAALKSIKDTYRYVGKAGQQPKAEPVDLSKFVPREQYEADQFYSENPEYKDMKGLISDMAKSRGIKASDVVKTDEFKSIFTKVKEHDEMTKSKSVLHSNPRLGQVTDKLTQAKEAMSQGNVNEAKQHAVGAVIDAFELNK